LGLDYYVAIYNKCFHAGLSKVVIVFTENIIWEYERNTLYAFNERGCGERKEKKSDLEEKMTKQKSWP